MAFKKGQSGNPAGRKAGQTPGAQIRKAIEEHKDEILNAVFDAAIGGDMTACKMLLDRITPPLKPVAANVTIPFTVDMTLADQGAAVIHAALSGGIPPDVGAQLITALSNQGKLVELQELTNRLERLEKMMEARI